jgi:hypothetical protein
LCSLTPPHEAVHRAAGRGRARMAGIAHAELGHAKVGQVKARQAKVANVAPTTSMPDAHAAQ